MNIPVDLSMTFNPIILPLVLAAIIMAWLGIFALTLRRSPLRSLFSVLMLSAALWITCYIFGLSSTSLSGKVFWLRVKYIFSALTPILWLVFSLYFTQRSHLLTFPVKGLLVVYYLVTMGVVFSSDLHGWMWQAVWIEPGLPEEAVIHGFYIWIYFIATLLFVISSAYFYIRFYFSVKKLFKLQALVMAISSIIPMVGGLCIMVLQIDLVPLLDEAILFLLISGLLFSYALFKLGALDIIPIAHDLVLQQMGLGVVVLDMQDRILEANPAALELLEIRDKSFIGRSASEVFSVIPTIDLSHEHIMDYAVQSSQDERQFYQCRINHIHQGKTLIGYLVLVSDVSEQKLAEAELTRMSIIDQLTEVINRRHFFTLAERELSRARRYGTTFSVLMMDLDHFKKINDTHGHLVGDEMLYQIAQYCQRSLRKGDTSPDSAARSSFYCCRKPAPGRRCMWPKNFARALTERPLRPKPGN